LNAFIIACCNFVAAGFSISLQSHSRLSCSRSPPRRTTYVVGGHIITNIPGVTPMKPGSCTLPMYGIDAVVLDAVDGHLLEPEEGKESVGGGVL